nr:tetratricopeptide repeat protein [uncultured Undibacterium sp.]
MPQLTKHASLKIDRQYDKALRLVDDEEFQQALDLCNSILSVSPKHTETSYLAASIFMRVGDVAQAMPLLETILQKSTTSTKYQQIYLDALVALFNSQQHELLISGATFFTDCVPSSGQGWHLLGVGLAHQHKYELARLALLQAKQLIPTNPFILCSLGNALSELHLIDEAVDEYRAAIALKADFAMAYNNIGNALTKTVHKEEALDNYRQAIEIKPDYADAYVNMGVLYKKMNKFDDAIVAYQKALVIEPESAIACNNLASALSSNSRVKEALVYSEKALLKEPERPEFWTTYADVLVDAFRLDEAIECYIKALSFKSDEADRFNQDVFASLLFYLNYHPDFPAEAIYGAYCDYEARFCASFRSMWKNFSNKKDVNRKLKVGYVSSAFSSHPCKHFLIPLIEHHQHQDFEIYAFAELDKSDEYTERYKQLVDHWVVITGMSDDAIAEKIRAEEIDVLVDISGHTGGHRLAVFARKPAPVSLHWLDFGYTTGLKAIDYYLTDQHNVPIGEEHLFSEHPWRLERHAFVFRPNPGMGEVGDSPVIKNGKVTFGTLTRAIRINHRTVRVWSEILKQVPNSTLIINSGNFRTGEVQEAMLARFAEQGIPRERIDIGYESPPWNSLRKIDIGFDCFPHNSGTTLFETLLMGVPFITLAGRASVGRLGSSILHGIGHPEWVAYSEEEYIIKAVALATDHQRLADIRSHLREEMQASEVMDEPGFTILVEQAYRQMWQIYCEEKKT